MDVTLKVNMQIKKVIGTDQVGMAFALKILTAVIVTLMIITHQAIEGPGKVALKIIGVTIKVIISRKEEEKIIIVGEIVTCVEKIIEIILVDTLIGSVIMITDLIVTQTRQGTYLRGLSQGMMI